MSGQIGSKSIEIMTTKFDRSVKFDRALNTSQIGWKFTENTLYASLVELGIIPMNSTGIYLNGFTPNLTGH